MKIETKLTLILLLAVLAIATTVAILYTPVTAAPLATTYGPTPLYDSGWVLTTDGFQNFEHNLDAIPTLWTLLVANDVYGCFVTESPNRRDKPSGEVFGHLVVNDSCDDFEVIWFPDGIGYAKHLSKWLQRTEAYARLIIYAADDAGRCGEGPPCRP